MKTRYLSVLMVMCMMLTLLLGTVAAAPDGGVALASTQAVLVDGNAYTFYAYGLYDDKGGLTNYVKLRDVAILLSGTDAHFQVDWKEGVIFLTTGEDYTAVGGELEEFFSGDQPYVVGDTPVWLDGEPIQLDAITLTDAKGGNHNYFKLRDLGQALNFNVGWNKETNSVYVESDKPYTDAD